MKKLNRKGFTLIELLAVIVILAIIVVVTVPTILNSIEDARKSALNSLAKEIANWYDTSYAQDMISIGNDKILDDVHLNHITGNTNAYCLKDIDGIYGDNELKNLAEIYGISDADIILDRYTFTFEDGRTTTACSFIKLKNGRAVVVLFGKDGGRFGKLISDDFAYDYTEYVSATLAQELK